MDNYICNFMLYSILEFVAKNNLSAKVAFFHVPMTMELYDAVEIVKALLKD